MVRALTFVRVGVVRSLAPLPICLTPVHAALSRRKLNVTTISRRCVTRETCPTKCHKRCDILHYCFRFPKRMQILSKSRSQNYLPINLLTLILTFPDFSVPGSFSNLPFPYPLPLSWSRPLPSPSHLFQFLHPASLSIPYWPVPGLPSLLLPSLSTFPSFLCSESSLSLFIPLLLLLSSIHHITGRLPHLLPSYLHTPVKGSLHLQEISKSRHGPCKVHLLSVKLYHGVYLFSNGRQQSRTLDLSLLMKCCYLIILYRRFIILKDILDIIFIISICLLD